MATSGSHIPVYLRIEQDLRVAIESGKLAPHTRMRSEPELAESYGVSRMTARKALDRLASEGLIFRQPGKGTFVATPKIAHGFSTQTSFSAAMDQLGLRHTTRVLEASLNPAPAAAAAALRTAPNERTVCIIRLRFVDDEPVALHSTYLPARFARILSADLTGSLARLLQQGGSPVVSANDTVEAVVASGDDARLLQVPAGAPLLRLEGIGRSAGGAPLRYTEALYRGDRFRFSLRDAKLDSQLMLGPVPPDPAS